MQRRIRRPKPSDGTVLLGVLSMIFSIGTATMIVVTSGPRPPIHRGTDPNGITANETPAMPARLMPGGQDAQPLSTALIEAELERQISFGSYEGY